MLLHNPAASREGRATVGIECRAEDWEAVTRCSLEHTGYGNQKLDSIHLTHEQEKQTKGIRHAKEARETWTEERRNGGQKREGSSGPRSG